MAETLPAATAVANIVTVVNGDIMNSTAQTIVNTVNCVGVMGKGVALAFKRQFPDMYQDYVGRCNRGEVKPGIPYLYIDKSGTRIVNFPTKDHWRQKSSYVWIATGLAYLATHVKEWGITSLALPPLGCTNGGLDWLLVKPMIDQKLGGLGIPVTVCLM